MTHPPTICVTGETQLRPVLQTDQLWNPWLVRPTNYHFEPRASSACGSAQRPVLPGSGEGVCASVVVPFVSHSVATPRNVATGVIRDHGKVTRKHGKPKADV